MGLFDWLKPTDPAILAEQAASTARQRDILQAFETHRLPSSLQTRLHGARTGARPWLATLSPAELLIARSHGLRPLVAISATCWLQYGWSWTRGHAEGWATALHRLRQEAVAAGGNAVLDVKMRTIPLRVENSMDFTLVGTAVKVDGLPPSPEPVVATVPALEFVKLLETDVVPVGIAVGAHYEWMSDWTSNVAPNWMGNIESAALSQLWTDVRRKAHADMRSNAFGHGGDRGGRHGNGVLAHVNFSEMFKQEGKNGQPTQYMARHIVVATVVDAARQAGRLSSIPHDISMMVDLHAGRTPLTGTTPHHQSYGGNQSEGAI